MSAAKYPLFQLFKAVGVCCLLVAGGFWSHQEQWWALLWAFMWSMADAISMTFYDYAKKEQQS